MIITDYSSEIYINEDILPDWTGFSASNTLGLAQIQASVDLQRPIDIEEGDTLTIKEGYEGDLFTIVDDKEIEFHSGTTEYRTITVGGTKITRKAPSKHVIFINQTWLDSVLPTYHFSNGIIYIRDIQGLDYKINGVSMWRPLFIPGLPGRETKDHEFECILWAGVTHHDIIKWLADQCGLDCTINTPNLAVQKTHLVSSAQPYFASINALISKWRPLVYIDKDEIFIMDYGADNRYTPSSGGLQLTEDSFEVYQWQVEQVSDVIDHCVIHGPDMKYTYNSINLKASKRRLSGRPLSGQTIETQDEEVNFDETQQSDLALNYVKNYNIYDKMQVRTVTTTKRKVNSLNPSEIVPIYEKVVGYNRSDQKINTTITKYEWADYNTPVKCTTEEYMRLPMVAGGTTEGVQGNNYQDVPDEEFVLFRTTETLYHDYLNDLGCCDSDKNVEGLCVTFRDEESYNDTTYDVYSNPVPIDQSLLRGEEIWEEKDGDIGYETTWEPISKTQIRYDQNSPNLLRKRRLDFIFLPFWISKCKSEDIPLPNRRRSRIMERRWEYFNVNGTTTLYDYDDTVPNGEYYPKVELHEMDVVTEADAKKIADRLFGRTGETNTRGQIKITASIPDFRVGFPISLPACTKRFFNWTTKQYEDITVPAKTFWITRHQKIVRYLGDPSESSREFEQYDLIDFAEYY